MVRQFQPLLIVSLGTCRIPVGHIRCRPDQTTSGTTPGCLTQQKSGQSRFALVLRSGCEASVLRHWSVGGACSTLMGAF